MSAHEFTDAERRDTEAEFRQVANMTPAGDVTDTRWRRSLMNWGHDPLR